ncbi:sulfurtransferase TusA family protein [Psychrobacter urativorans]|uniref:sulfurtransferase TusA family protein n=1 Tax=Psychrobacter urativorans TaxID=45610 RepID=UPI001918D959|nr:sulfurtransferase TusA family protein [Psychrobacter urativorans]
MNADNCSNSISSQPYLVCLAPTLVASDKDMIVTNLRLLPAGYISDIQSDTASLSTERAHNNGVTIKALVDGRGLACPMPLLKTKVALRNLAIGDSLYVIATDPNSRADITAFCQHTQQASNALGLQLILNKSTTDQTMPASIETKTSASFDTIFHFIITKTDSN